MVHGNVRRQLRLGDGAECLRHEPECGRRFDNNQALLFWFVLRPEDESLQKGILVRHLDGLYWRWVWLHSDELAKNPRWAMMCSMAKKMDPEKRSTHLETANNYLATLEKQR